jgi:hypothetical protein
MEAAVQKMLLFLIENNQSNKCSVFERFFSFLSFQILLRNDKKILFQLSNEQTNFLILDSLSLLEKSRNLVEKRAHSSLP